MLLGRGRRRDRGGRAQRAREDRRATTIPLDGLRPYQARALFQPLLQGRRAGGRRRPTSCSSSSACTPRATARWPRSIRSRSRREGQVLALDAKVMLDDNADFRHREWATWRDPDEETPGAAAGAREGALVREARRRHRLRRQRRRARHGDDGPDQALRRRARELPRHRRLVEPREGDGGAQDHHRRRAHCEGGSAAPAVRAILFNIFGGITRCDDVANGIVQSLEESPLQVPLVIRLTGTNEELARKILVGLRALGHDQHGRGACAR